MEISAAEEAHALNRYQNSLAKRKTRYIVCIRLISKLFFVSLLNGGDFAAKFDTISHSTKKRIRQDNLISERI